MSDGTAIQWTDATWNPVRAKYSTTDDVGQVLKTGWHCERVSPGCQHCYAERLNEKRFGTGLPYNRKSRDMVEVYLDERALSQPLHWRKPRRVFVCSMTDLFAEWVPDEWLDRVFAVMALASQHKFQVLTKRPERMREYLNGLGADTPEFSTRWDVARRWLRSVLSSPQDRKTMGRWEYVGVMMAYQRFPLPNVWLGVSTENQGVADERIPELLATPAAVRWLSCEPLLEPVEPALDGIDWVVVGGESGPEARTCNVDWIRGIVQQCQGARVPVFVKQLGARPVGLPPPESWRGLARPDGHLRDRAGGDPAEWPEDLRVRQYPEVGR